MSSMTLFILFVAIIALLFLFINLVFAPHNPYQEKDSMFECGFHSFQQSRSPFNIAFFIYALVYLLLDLEILLTFPFAVSEYVNNIYGLIITLGFITIITIGFVYELGKGALKIPSKQHTYTIKNQPLINISYIKTKSVKISKAHPFIDSPLQSSILPFTISIKNFSKYFTFKNIIIGLISLIIMSLVKTLGISMYILNLFNLENIELLEYITVGIFGLVSRLGFRGIVEAIFADNYATMGGEDSTQESSSPLDSNLPEKGKQKEGSGGWSSDGNNSPERSTQTQEADKGKATSSPMLIKAFGGSVNRLIEEVKNLNLSMEKAQTDEEWRKFRDQRDANIEHIQMLSQASAEEVKKLISSDSNSSASKRDIDVVEKENKVEGPSKKK